LQGMPGSSPPLNVSSASIFPGPFFLFQMCSAESRRTLFFFAPEPGCFFDEFFSFQASLRSRRFFLSPWWYASSFFEKALRSCNMEYGHTYRQVFYWFSFWQASAFFCLRSDFRARPNRSGFIVLSICMVSFRGTPSFFPRQGVLFQRSALSASFWPVPPSRMLPLKSRCFPFSLIRKPAPPPGPDALCYGPR